MTKENTLVLIKPDGVQRGIIGEILTRFEKVGMKIVGMKMVQIDSDFAKKHYYDIAERHGEKVLKKLTGYLSSAPVLAFVLEGVNAIENVRKMVGKTEPGAAAPGTIRGDYAHMNYARAEKTGTPVLNLIHASANKEDAEHEINLWFSDAEIWDYEHAFEKFI